MTDVTIADAVASADDWRLERLHHTYIHIGSADEHQQYVYVYSVTSGNPGSSYRILPLVALRKGVQPNMRISDSQGRQLVFLSAARNAEIARQRAAGYLKTILEELAEPDVAATYLKVLPTLRERSPPHTPLPQTAHHVGLNLQALRYDEMFCEISEDQDVRVQRAVRHAIEAFSPLASFCSHADLPQRLTDAAERLENLVRLHSTSFIPYVQLEEPLDPTGRSAPAEVFIRHEVDTKRRHERILSQEWWGELHLWEHIKGVIGVHHPKIHVSFDADLTSFHLKVVAPPGLRFRWITVEGTRPKWRRSLVASRNKYRRKRGRPPYEEELTRDALLKTGEETLNAWQRAEGPRKRALEKELDRARLRMLEFVFHDPRGKHRRRTRNDANYYIHLPKGHIEVLSAWAVLQLAREPEKPAEPLATCFLTEAGESLFLSYVPIPLISLIAILPEWEEILGAGALAALFSWALYTSGKPLLTRIIAGRTVLVAGLSLLGYFGLRWAFG